MLSYNNHSPPYCQLGHWVNICGALYGGLYSAANSIMPLCGGVHAHCLHCIAALSVPANECMSDSVCIDFGECSVFAGWQYFAVAYCWQGQCSTFSPHYIYVE